MSKNLDRFIREKNNEQRSVGRPAADFPTVQVTVRLRPDQVEELKALAARKRSVDTSNVSAIIRMAVDESFAR